MYNQNFNAFNGNNQYYRPNYQPLATTDYNQPNFAPISQPQVQNPAYIVPNPNCCYNYNVSQGCGCGSIQ